MTPRHVLLVATQCADPDMLELTELDRAADELYQVLTDPDIGAMDGARTPAASTAADIEAAVRVAVQRAASEDAVLVLAFLGHGFAPGSSAALYYMAHDTLLDSPSSGVDLAGVIRDAAQQSRIPGVIGLIDTCHGAASVPDAGALVAGIKEGRTKVSMLMACSAGQSAFRMAFSRALAALVAEGLPAAGPTLRTSDLIGPLRERVKGQTPAEFVFDGDRSADEPLWVARNTAYAIGAADVGTLGRAELLAALPGNEHLIPDRWTLDALRAAREGVRAADPSGRAAQVLESVTYALGAADFLAERASGKLSTVILRSAARRAHLPEIPRTSGTVLLGDLTEVAALKAVMVGRSPWEPLARFVAAVAEATGVPSDDERLRHWAKRFRVDTELTDGFTALAAEPHGPRLVISLGAALTDWPATVTAWLLGPDGSPSETFACPSAGQVGTEGAIRDALIWALRRCDTDTLTSIDIAAPAHLLAKWHPERSVVGARMLGVDHRVFTQWSGRLEPGEATLLNAPARQFMRSIADTDGVPVDWVRAEQLAEPATLLDALAAGSYKQAIGIDHRPADLADTIGTLLPYSPILLWPRPDHTTDRDWEKVVGEHWDTLPDGFVTAYRDHCTGTDDTGLSGLRAAWHDEQWLEFCRRCAERAVVAPEGE